MFKRFILLSACFVVGLSAFSAVAVEKDVISMMSVKQRLERVERLLGSDVLMEQAQQIELLKEEITMLREQIDQQGYELNLLKQRQRSLYLDMDRRIHSVEIGSPASSGLSTAPVPAPGMSELPVAKPTTTGSNKNASIVVATPQAKSNEKQEYDKAFNLLTVGHYKDAIVAFEDFLKKYSDSQYADNAQYWLGEANYANREYKQALSEFQRLIAMYPDSRKGPGARLKIAYVYYELKNWSAAQDSLQQVIKLYPDSSVAKKANDRLERIKREGH